MHRTLLTALCCALTLGLTFGVIEWARFCFELTRAFWVFALFLAPFVMISIGIAAAMDFTQQKKGQP